MFRIVLSLIAGSLLAAGSPAARAETHHTCSGFIDTVPATITTQGTWCLRHDLATSIASGAAITIATNNVSIDCNGFKLGGLGAGDMTQTRGIYADQKLAITVRNCHVRGFRTGIHLFFGGGHLVHDSRFEQNRAVGINVSGDGSIIRDNQVLDTGDGFTDPGGSYPTPSGIVSSGGGIRIRDNLVHGVVANGFVETDAVGISTSSDSAIIEGNTVSGIEPFGTGDARGIASNVISNRNVIRDNTVIGTRGGTPQRGAGIRCVDNEVVKNNVVSGYEIALSDCPTVSGNTIAD
jgi:hypothetical protein